MVKSLLLIFMEKTSLFLFVAFGDFRKQVKLFFLGMSHSWARTHRFLYFSVFFPPFDISKRFFLVLF